MQLSDRRSNPDVPKALIAILALGHCMAFIDRNLPAVAAPLLKADLGLTDTQLGVLDGPAFVLLYVAGMLATWPLARSRHRFACLAGCVAAWAMGTIVFAFGHSFMVLVGARALTGLGQAAYVPLALTLIVECVATRWRARSIAVFTAGAAVGRSLCMVLGGAALTLFARWMPGTGFAHWRLLCLVMAVPNLALILALLCRAEPARAIVPAPRDVLRQMLSTFRTQPALLCAYLCGAGASVLVVQTVGAWAPSVLHREQGLAPGTAAWVFGTSLLIAAPMGHFIAGLLVDKRRQNMPPTVIIAYALLVVIPLLYLIPRATSPAMSCGLLALASLVADIAALAALAGLPSMLRASLHDAGWRIFMAFITLTGVALGPFMTGVVSDGRGMGGHGLSLAVAHVCVGAATIGIVAALIARTGWYRAAREAAA